MPTTNAVERFFSQLQQTGHVQLLEGASGTLQVDLNGGEKPWFVTIKRGDVSVSRQVSQPDCVLWTDTSTFEAIVEGRMNAFAALLRGLLEVDGQIHLLVALQAFFRPSSGAAEQPAAGYAGRRR